ncbi:MAG: endonuclease/exonuclease/phosphatase family protein [Pirellulales bacterium]|nr:endonuclease/exonuclease/phosphatase family protein [Pirellulales bacterium]
MLAVACSLNPRVACDAEVLAWSAEASSFRVATFNASLYRNADGQLIRDLQTGHNEQARHIAEVIQRVRPDVLLLNEFDYDEPMRAAKLFHDKYLAIGQSGCQPIQFDFTFSAPVNTGVPSGRDLNHNGRSAEPDDSFGYGRHAGQYGMLVLSRFPIERSAVHTFQKFLWKNMPDAMLPIDPKSGQSFYDSDDLAILRLSSKSFWDLPIRVKVGAEANPREFTFHFLCSHPTPPVFDGPEDRNGRRNHDEVRLIADYITPERGKYLVDDANQAGGLPPEQPFVIVGDLNCDPLDGEGLRGTMPQLLEHPRVNAAFTPTSKGGPLIAKQFPNQFTKSRGNPAHVTANFTQEGHGCMRIDYVLPSTSFQILSGGIFWPEPNDPAAKLSSATDHHCVWLDLATPPRTE